MKRSLGEFGRILADGLERELNKLPNEIAFHTQLTGRDVKWERMAVNIENNADSMIRMVRQK